MKKNLIFILLLTASVLTLQGCIFAVGAAAGAAAITAVNDHRTIERTLEDTRLANKIANKIRTIPSLRDDSHVDVTVFNNVVLLTGQTPNAADREQAEAIARAISGSSKVYNQLTIQGPTSSLTRTSDSWITTKIKGQMVATEDLKSSSVKVVTENGVVYLMGIVNRQQADATVDIARQISGVQKVVKIFQYTN